MAAPANSTEKNVGLGRSGSLSVGAIPIDVDRNDALARARLRAALIPDLLVEAQRISNTVVGGWHGRKRRGIGDTFWQFRPYNVSESLSRIDWRRSARDDSITVRDKEWEAAHTVWVWADNSASMLYQSRLADVSKQSRALVLALALAEVLSRSGERVGWPGTTRALSSRHAAERIASELMFASGSNEASFPPDEWINKRSELVMMSDFLDPVETLMERMSALAQRGVRGTMIQIIDPAEEHFPYSGRTEFLDPESGRKLVSGRAETLSEDYAGLFDARRTMIGDHCRRIGWHHLIHHTDQLASTVLVAVHMRLTGQTGATP